MTDTRRLLKDRIEAAAKSLCEPRHRDPDGWPLVGVTTYCGKCFTQAEVALAAAGVTDAEPRAEDSAPVVPDSADVRGELLHVLDSHGIDTYIDGAGAEVGVQNLITDILAVVGPRALTPPTLPSVKDVARRHSRANMDGTCICGATGIGFTLGYSEHLIAETLALLPGRTESEVKAEALREAAEAVRSSIATEPYLMHVVDWVEGIEYAERLLRDRAAHTARGEGS